MTANDHLRLAMFHTLRAKPFLGDPQEWHDHWLAAQPSLERLLRAKGIPNVNGNQLLEEGLLLPIHLEKTEDEAARR